MLIPLMFEQPLNLHNKIVALKTCNNKNVNNLEEP